MTNWKHIKTLVDGERFELYTLNIWEHAWKDIGKRIHVKDPLYGQPYSLTVFAISAGELYFEFAAGEFSNCVWGIYMAE